MAEIFVYGATCVWWDSIDKSATINNQPGGLPCCPHCGGVLFESTDTDWNEAVAKRDVSHPGYKALMDWLRGKCYRTMREAEAAYAAEQGPLTT